MSTIHPTAIIEDGAKLGNDVTIGPYCLVGKHVTLGDRVVLKSHVVIQGHTCLGDETTVYPFASLGHAPQDLKYHGEPSTLKIGKRNTIREHVTMNPGTENGIMKTVIGDGGLFMIGVHVAHDCVIGNNVILANNVTLAGHVEIEDNAIIGGLSAVKQFVRIGRNAMIGGMSGVESDVIPYGLVIGERAHLAGLNIIGMKRYNFEKEQINELRQTYSRLFSGDTNDTLAHRIDTLEANQNPLIRDVVFFLKNRAQSGRPLCQPKSQAA